VTYNNSCIAEAIGVLVDHYGACESVGIAAGKHSTVWEDVFSCPFFSLLDLLFMGAGRKITTKGKFSRTWKTQ